jgi:hypothetical protein
MSNWNGKHGRGAMKSYRAQKRQEAEERQTACTDGGASRELREGYTSAGNRGFPVTPADELVHDVFEKKCNCIASIRPHTACICQPDDFEIVSKDYQ